MIGNAHSIALLALLGIIGLPHTVSAESTKEIAGTYTLVSLVNDVDGKKTEVFGANPKGMMIFGADGHYVQLISRAGLSKFSAKSRMEATAEENKAVVQGTIAHYGTYSVNDADKAIVFHIETSSFPNWNGTEQKRPFTVKGDELIYKVPSPSVGVGTAEAVWKRVK